MKIVPGLPGSWALPSMGALRDVSALGVVFGTGRCTSRRLSLWGTGVGIAHQMDRKMASASQELCA